VRQTATDALFFDDFRLYNLRSESAGAAMRLFAFYNPAFRREVAPMTWPEATNP
jgi:hypothetical protein